MNEEKETFHLELTKNQLGVITQCLDLGVKNLNPKSARDYATSLVTITGIFDLIDKAEEA